MAASVIQTGTSLQLLSETGDRTLLTTPAGVTIDGTLPPRWAAFDKNVVLVNTPSVPLTIDAAGTVRVLTPHAPRLAPVLAGVSGGTLSGTFKVKDTFVILDAFGNIISESDYSPSSSPVTIATKFLGVSNIDISGDTITLRRLYRTTNNGAVFFQWIDVDGNVITTAQDDLADAGLSVFAAPVLGTPPHLRTIAEFRGRLFGGATTDIDFLRYTETGLQYAWPIDNVIQIAGFGSDSFGIWALAARRESLCVGRRNLLTQITGTGAESNGNTDLDPVIVSREVGVESQETMKVFRDTVYFLWKDGVYTWGPDGITCISDGRADGTGAVRSWFATDNFFNRDQFVNAFAHIDQTQAIYRLFLCEPGSLVATHWVEYSINDRTWFGPHKTGLFTPVSAFSRSAASDRKIPLIGAASAVYEETPIRTDGYAVPVVLDVLGKQHDGDIPDQQKFFGETSVLGNALSEGILTLTSKVGKRDEQEVIVGRTVVQQYDMTKGRKRLGRLGNGEHCEIQFTNSTTGDDVQFFGYEIDPVFVIGRR